MIAAAIQCNWFVAPGSNDISYRAVGLGILVIGGYLALRSPRWFKHPAMGRSAQLSVGIYASLAAIAAGILAISMVPGSTGWLSGAAGDGMSDAGLFLFLSMVLLLGALLALNSTLDLCERRVNMGCLMGGLTWLVGILDAIVLGYLWLGPIAPSSSAACASGPAQDGAGAMILITLVVAAVTLWSALSPFVRLPRMRPLLISSGLPALAGVIVEVGLMVASGADSWRTGSRLDGMDLMVAGALLGLCVYLLTLAGSRKPTSRTATASIGG